MKMRPADKMLFHPWVGKTVTGWAGTEECDELYVTFDDGLPIVCSHLQSCCEWVEILKMPDDFNDLIGQKLTGVHTYIYADEYPPGWTEEMMPRGEYDELPQSWTFTVMTFEAGEVRRTLYWLGTSNGYYSERVELMTHPDKSQRHNKIGD